MAITGDSINIALAPRAQKNIDPAETFVPFQISLHNGKLSDAGNWVKRSGYTSKYDVSNDKAIHLLVPRDDGYAATDDGNVYKLGSTVSQLTVGLLGSDRPTWVDYDDKIIICDGGRPIKIESNQSSVLDGSPPSGKYVDVLKTYTLISGHDETEVKYSVSNNPEDFASSGSGSFNVAKHGGSIMNMKALRDILYIFKERNIETWIFMGGVYFFVAQDGGLVLKGCGASYSVVQANNTLYWFGDDGDFYRLDGFSPIVISQAIREEINKLPQTSDIFGFDCRKEHCIRWTAPTSGKTFRYDYLFDMWSEDNHWEHGQFERLPMNSYMELGNDQFFGDYNCTGTVFDWNDDNKDDSGRPIRVFRNFKYKFSENGNNARIKRARIRMKRGVATTSVTSPIAQIRWNVDGMGWNMPQDMDLGEAGDYEPYFDVHGLGIGQEIEMEITQTDNTEFILTDCTLTYQLLGN
jgi:hypothetical protein